MFSRVLGGEHLSGRTKRTAARGLRLLVVAASLLAACTRVEIEDHSLQFNQATGSLGNRVMLLNVVRAAKGYSIQFSKVSGYTGQSRLDGGVNLSIPFIADMIGKPSSAILQGTVQPNSQLKSGVSSLQLADLSTAEFQRSLRRKVTPNDFAYYRSQGWPKALVNTILIEELLLEPELRKALKRASERICGETGSGRAKYREVCTWLLNTATHCVEENVEQRASPDGDLYHRYSNDPRDRCRHVSFQWFFAAIRVLPGATLEIEPKVNTDECTSRKALLKDLGSSAKDGKGKSKDAGKGPSETVKDGKVSVEVNVKIADKADKDDDGSDKAKDAGSIGLSLPRGLRNLNLKTIRPTEIPALVDLRNEYVCLLKEGKMPIVITWRSPERMVRYLGEVLAVQKFGSGDRKIKIFNEEDHLVELLRVESGRDPLGRAAVSVEGPERESFYIPVPDRDNALRGSHMSLQALALVMEAVNLAISGKELPRSPTFFLSGG